MCIRDSHIINNNNNNNEIVHVFGSNVSLIDNIELERIQQNSIIPISTLPINNLSLIHI